MISTQPHRAGRHVWKQASAATRQKSKSSNPDVIVECYLDAKHYHYDPVELTDLSDINANFALVVCVEESGSRVVHWRRKVIDNQE